MRWSLGRTEASAFIGAILVVAAVNAVSYVSTRRLIESSARLTHTHQVIAKLEEVRSDLFDAETDQRNHIVTGREGFLGTYQMALDELRRDVTDVRALTADNPEQQLRLDELEPTIDARVAELGTTLEALKAHGFGAAQELIRSDRGTRLMEAVRQSINTMQHAEERLAEERTRTSEVRAEVTLMAVIAGSVLALLALFLAMYRINRNVEKRRQAESALREAYGLLDARVEQRTAELALVNTELRGEIAERKQGEVALQHLRRQYQLILDAAGDGIYGLDHEGAVTFANPAALRMLGWEAEGLQGKAAHVTLHHSRPDGSAYPREECPIDAAFNDGTTRHVYDEVFWKMDGSPLPVEYVSTALRDEDGRAIGAVVTFTDVTDKKKIEAQLLRAQRMESIGTLAGGIAHDLNNVLAPILMAIEVLKRRVTDERSHRLFGTLEVSAQRGADMVKQILTFARGVEGARMVLQPRHLLEDIEKFAAETFPKTIQVRVDAASDLWGISGDATQLHQVLLNLAVNARDAMPDGGVLSIAATNAELDGDYARVNIDAKPGPYVMLSVTDTGTGIPPAVLEKIFEPFFTTKEVGKGTGLGLSTTHAIVKSHGGFVHVYSESGKGSVFKVYLPAFRGAMVAAGVKAPELPTGNGQLILVVDDEASIREIAKETLESYGYRTLLAADGTEAVALFASSKAEISAVVTDMRMPFMDGAATIRALRRLDPRVRIIAASGLGADEAEASAGAGSIQALLHKPYTAEKLLTTLKEILAGGHA